MQKIKILGISLLFLTSCNLLVKKEKQKCLVICSSVIPRVSVHDQINPQKYTVKTQCGNFVSTKYFFPGDSVEVTLVKSN
jgi:hypothetical protein